MTDLIAYFIGFIIVFITCKILRNKAKNNAWDDVGITFVISLFSWVSAILMLIYIIGMNISKIKIPILNKICTKFKLTKPPKWL